MTTTSVSAKRPLAGSPSILPPLTPSSEKGLPLTLPGISWSAKATVGVANAGLQLAPPAPQSLRDFIPDAKILGSPVLLADYIRWSKDSDAFYAKGTLTKAYADLAMMFYDREIGRPWGDQFYPELNKKLTAFRTAYCAAGADCTLPAEVKDDAAYNALAKQLLRPELLKDVEARSGFHLHQVTFPNGPRAFDLIGDLREDVQSGAPVFWGMKQRPLSWTYTTPLMHDVGTYEAGFNQAEFPGQFSFDGDKIIVNDWQLRDRAMQFAHLWKFAIDFNKNAAQYAGTEERQYQKLFDSCKDELETSYRILLPQVRDSDKVRFAKEHDAGDFPDEVYQHVAYKHLSDLLRLESGYFALARDQRHTTSPRQQQLEALLTLQRYAPDSAGFFMMELTTRSQLLASRAAVIDQIADPMLAFTYTAEQLKAILGMELYADSALYDRYRNCVMSDELFPAEYLKEYNPKIYKELLKADGTLKRVADLPREDQIRILRTYLMPDDAISISGLLRLEAVFAEHASPQQLQDLADVIHAKRFTNAGNIRR
jgi:hypothetical protein